MSEVINKMDFDFLQSLNEAQHKASVNTDGPALVIAGAGSGKTRVLTYRISCLLKMGVKPGQILALTFTNKAAREMKERIAAMVGDELTSCLWMGTFHSIFARILRFEADAIGYPSNFTIYDTSDSRSVVKTVIKELKLDEEVYKPAEVFSRISAAKNNMVTVQAYNSDAGVIERDRLNRKSHTGEIYRMYAIRCRKSGAMDFDDLLLNTNILFRDFPEILQKYQERFRYILVDEFQDTNYAQYLIVNRLSAIHRNLCVVGDDAQSIYAFRGAKIENILDFKVHYPDYKLFKLEQNYRSTKNIVNGANSLIEKNSGQIKKNVWSENSPGQKISIVEVATDNEEGFLVAGTIFDTVYRDRQQYADFAILYRTNAQSRIFEEALRKRNLPYKVYGGLSFYQRKEIKDLLAYLRLVVNPADDEAFKRIINYPARGIGSVTLEKIEVFGQQSDIPLLEALSPTHLLKMGFNRGTAEKLNQFGRLIDELREQVDQLDAYDFAFLAASKSGMLEDMRKGNTPEDKSRLDNVEELLNGIRDFVEQVNLSTPDEPTGIVQYLENVSLLTDLDNEKPEDRNKVSLMTIHSAKGLEYNHVFIAGVEDQLFPSPMSSDTLEGLEEERRLFYVAITRARQQVTISYAKSRYRWGTPTDCRPSRFLRDIDPAYTEWARKPGEKVRKNRGFFDEEEEGSLSSLFVGKQTGREKGQMARQAANNYRNTPPAVSKKPFNRPNDPNFVHDNPELIQTGMRVEHQQFGMGKVIHIDGNAPDRKATVFFSEINEEKMLLLKFAKLKILTTEF